MSEKVIHLEPLEVKAPRVGVPGATIIYPGNDAWVQLQRGVSAPGADPAWAMVEKTPPAPGTPAVPGKVFSTTGNPPLLSGAQSVFGFSSLNPLGTGSALVTPNHADWNFGSGDFTIDGRFRFTTVRTALFGLQNRADQSDRGWEWTMDVMPSGTPGFTFYCNDVTVSTAWDHQYDQGFVVTLNQWYHMAVVRNGANLHHFVDGTLLGTNNIGSTVIRNSSQPLTVLGDARVSSNDFRGFCDELRISKGIARWTSNFTPPAAPYTKDAYTVLLCHFDGTAGTTPTEDDTGIAAIPGPPFDPGTNPAWLHLES